MRPLAVRVARLSGHCKLDKPETDPATHKNKHKQATTFYQRFKRALHKPRFVLEILALLVVVFYTYEAWLANSYTRRSNEAVFDFNPVIQWDRAIIVYDLVNKGKASARDVEGRVELTVRDIITNRVIQTEQQPFENIGSAIRPESGFDRMFSLNTQARDEPTMLKEFAQQVVIMKVDMHYKAGFEGITEWLLRRREYQSFCKEYVTDVRLDHGPNLLLGDCDNVKPWITKRQAQIKLYGPLH
jgi:hypothetical protein